MQACTAQRHVTHRHCPRLVLATATPTLAALRPAHDHARAEHTRHARTTRARLASDAHAFTLQQALARQKQGWHARVTGHWLTVGLPTACASGSHTRCKCARPPPPLLVRRVGSRVMSRSRKATLLCMLRMCPPEPMAAHWRRCGSKSRILQTFESSMTEATIETAAPTLPTTPPSVMLDFDRGAELRHARQKSEYYPRVFRF